MGAHLANFNKFAHGLEKLTSDILVAYVFEITMINDKLYMVE